MIVTKSCCCFGLRTGAVIVGWFGLVGGIIWIATGFGLLAHIDEIVPKDLYYVNSIPHERINETILEASKIINIFAIVKGVINIIINVLLLWGTNKANHLMLLPWLLMEGLLCSIIIIGILIAFVKFLITGAISLAILIVLLGFCVIFFPVYIWLCIFSLYQRFRQDSKENIFGMNEIRSRSTAPIIGNTLPPYISFQ